MAEKKKFKFNIIDIIVLVVLIAAICFGAYKLFFDRLGNNGGQKEQDLSYTVEFFCEETPTFSAELVQVGDTIVDEYMDVPLGTVTSVELAPSVSYASNAEGQWVKSTKEDYSSLKITADLSFKGTPYEHGFQVETSKYGVGHSMTFRAGTAKLYGRISAIEQK